MRSPAESAVIAAAAPALLGAAGNTALGGLAARAAASPAGQTAIRAYLGYQTVSSGKNAVEGAIATAQDIANGRYLDALEHGTATALSGLDATQAGKALYAATKVCPLPWNGCFLAGTLVATEQGPKRIEAVAAGEQVWACDLVSGTWVLRNVVETYQTDYVGEKVRFHVAGEWVESTKHHPVWVAEGEGLADRPKPDHVREAELEVESATVPGRWVDAGDLQVGDVLLKRSGERVAIETIEVEAIVTQVYNFQVAELHNYAVGLNGLLVHNNAPCIRNSQLAGQNHPVTGIPFDEDGFPDFSKVATHQVNIQFTGNRAADFRAANAAAGLLETPADFTWHHHQNMTTMQLVPSEIHRLTGHTGGFSLFGL